MPESEVEKLMKALKGNPKNNNDKPPFPTALKKAGKKAPAPIPSPPTALDRLISIFCCDSLKRLEGRGGFAIPLLYKKNQLTNEPQKLYSVHLFYQMFIGSIGGVSAGIETGYLSFTRIPTIPNTAFPPHWHDSNAAAQNFLRNTSVIWNISKRAIIAGLLFDLIDKNVEEARGTRGWFNFGAAGLISGAIFGLRGGTRGVLTSSLGMGFFGSLAGFFTYFGKPPGDE